MPALDIHLTVDAESAGRSAYETFVARNANPKPWAQLNEQVRESWRAIATSVLPHVGEVVKP